MSQVVCSATSFTSEEENDMGDLEYIQGFVTSGNYFQVTGAIDAVNDTIEYIVPNGKTAFLIEAKINLTNIPSIGSAGGSVDAVKAELNVDGVGKDITSIGVRYNFGGAATSEGAASWGFIGDGRFNVKGISLVGDGAKVIEIENVVDNGAATATMSGYLIDT